MSFDIRQQLTMRAGEVESALARLFEDRSEAQSLATLRGAMRHATMVGGKRLRPFLVIECAEMVGGKGSEAMPAACAIEMIHSYSLVHDDLPAMDDADTRRGQPSVHIAFDEAVAILAGDGLLTDAFTVLTDGAYDTARAAQLVHTLSLAAGSVGMVGGQMMDLYPGDLTEAEIIAIQERKTGALIEAGAIMGGIVGGATDDELSALKGYASAIGLAFQIVDDVLDVTRTSEELGKPAGADEDAGKATFVSLLGLDGARARVASLTQDAHKHLEAFSGRADILLQLADDLATRTK